MKKSANLVSLVNYANVQLQRNIHNFGSTAFKQGVIVMLEHALHNANAYDGYLLNNVNEPYVRHYNLSGKFCIKYRVKYNATLDAYIQY